VTNRGSRVAVDQIRRHSQTDAGSVFGKLNLAEHFACHGPRRLLVFHEAVPKERAEKMGTTWGYARVSTEDQELGLQITALRAAGVPEANIVQEKASGRWAVTGRSTPACWNG
jgi:hypothetical protein